MDVLIRSPGNSGRRTLSIEQKEVGGFVQDQIRLRSNLQLTLGVRWDWQNYLHDANNFAPRASIAYAFGEKRNTVLRAGGGLGRRQYRPVESRLSRSVRQPSRSLGSGAESISIKSKHTDSLSRSSVALERQVFESATISATYRGLVGVSLFSSLNVNQPLPPFFLHAAIRITVCIRRSNRRAARSARRWTCLSPAKSIAISPGSLNIR
jgi:outer membrane receptor protein involved in Fe transport